MSRPLAIVMTIVAVIAMLLSVKTAYDLLFWTRVFPAWFVPLFAIGMVLLIGYTVLVTRAAWRPRPGGAPVSRPVRIALWTMLPLSFVATSGVHGFAPFGPPAFDPEMWAHIDHLFRLNLILAAAGFLATIVLAIVFFTGREAPALTGLACLCFVLMIPNDDCYNPFNAWWVDTIGASPLMYVPNMYASVFAIAGLTGTWSRLNTLAVGATVVSVGLLGLGHILRFIW